LALRGIEREVAEFERSRLRDRDRHASGLVVSIG
jgi:hypothetical protein